MKGLEDYTPDHTSEDISPVDSRAFLSDLSRSIWALRTTHWAEFLSTLTTTIACIVGGCQVGLLGGDEQLFTWIASLGTLIGFGLGTLSGGFGNPIVTVGMAYTRRLSPQKARTYLVMQFVGALLGATVAYIYYSPAIDVFEGGKGIRTVSGSAKFFTTIYAPDALPFGYRADPPMSHMFSQALIVLLHSTFIPVDPSRPSIVIPPLLSCFAVIGRLAVNPARDLAPCLVLHAAGYGGQVWTQGSVFYWPITLISTAIAATFGASVGIGLERKWKQIEEDEEMENRSETGALWI